MSIIGPVAYKIEWKTKKVDLVRFAMPQLLCELPVHPCIQTCRNLFLCHDRPYGTKLHLCIHGAVRKKVV